ncbi:DNA mismatch repair endonuclease MutL [Candidatus Latescibacterota bacterium]
MAKIKILSDIIANKIAAGEVVERPASVVKELVENAIDAGADAITVEIEKGGARLIRVSDNGTGMNADDALLSIERHATSKIETVSDIENIITLGFRGEALPSIVSVSKATIVTKEDTSAFGTRLVIDGGVLRNVTEVGRDRGTDIEIKNLFFNLPARRKFMKTESTELAHIKKVLYDYAVASPGISLTLISNGKEIFSYRKCSDRTEMLSQILGESISRYIVPVQLNVDGIEIEGFLGKPETASTSFDQFIIVNGRPVKSKSILRSIMQGYGHSLPKGLYPAFILYFEIDPKRVDVNIHPSKREIRIHRDFTMIQALRDTVSRAFQTMTGAPEFGEKPKSFLDYKDTGAPAEIYNPPEQNWVKELSGHASPDGLQAYQSQTEFAFRTDSETAGVSEYKKDSGEGEFRYEGPSFLQLNDLYIIATVREGAIIIDQHAAHERILYEEILANLRGKPASSQQLLFPATYDFSAADFDVLEPMIPHLNNIGFGIREFGDRTVLVDAVPAGLSRFGEGNIFHEFIDEMSRFGEITSGYIDKLAASLACRAAIKSGKHMNQAEMRYLVDRLFATNSPFTCPHGRPTVVKLTLDELTRRFGR